MAGKKTGSANQNTRKKMNPQRIPGAREQRAASGRTVQTRSVAGARSGRQQASAQRERAERAAERERTAERERRRRAPEQSYEPESEIGQNIFLVVAILISVIVFLSYIGVCGAFGDVVNSIVFGLFGVLGYVFPFVFAGLSAYSALSRRSDLTAGKIAGIIIMFVLIAALVQIAVGGYSEELKLLDYFSHSAPGYEGTLRTYGGLLGGTISYLFCPMLGNVATVVILLAAIIILLILVTGKAIFSYIRDISEEKSAQRRERRENSLAYEQDEDPDAEYYRGDLLDDHKVVRRRIRLQSPVIIEKVGDIMEEDDPDELFGRKRKKKSETGFIDDLRKRGTVPSDSSDEPEKKSEDVLQAAFELEEIGGRKSIADSDEITSEEDTQSDVPFYKQELERKYGKQSIEIANLRRSPYADSIVIGRTEDVGPFYDDPDVEITDRPDNVVSFPHPGATKEESERASFLSDSYESDAEYEEDDLFETEESSYSDSAEAFSEVKALASGRDTAGKRKPQHSDSEENADLKQEAASKEHRDSEQDASTEELEMNDEPVIKQYVFPPIDILKKPKGGGRTTSDAELRETARKLEDTFESFGVGVTVTDVSCGPTVTRYELHPEQGVKVSKITALTDDIKLNLAAADIRIEAPIPGKAAVGIEIPNKENTVVLLRELLESGEFESHSSNIAFAVGKDIGGKTVVTDIAKMPHLLIAGATGSGKSVCINTLIMSILYKAKPEDVKLIMVDPKVVELSVYNGIPHLLIPVVTDPKKASAALNWAVMEMTNRYKLFADAGVRDLKGYNERVDEELLKPRAEGEPVVLLNRLPQIVIIVDELADLMMVAPGEVEDAICRLAQLARAAGIHLVIATQRPSVNVITGLIKANVPSRIAFAVSSAIDSRTILDGGGAEKLLGRGDMLFFPSGYPKPVRLQGAFVSDKEVADVVDFLKGQCEDASDKGAEIERQIETVSLEAAKPAQAPDDGRDEYFAEAARFIIEKEKASIGLLQRVYKIGFNRAARIMDQLCEAGVVGPEEGTKPRKILMTLEDLDNLLGADAPKGGKI